MSDIEIILRRNLSQAVHERQFEQAAQILERLKQEAPLALATRGWELEYLLRAGHLDEAQALANQLLELFPDSGRILYLAGRLAYRKKEYALAEQRLRESQRIYPHWRSRRWLGKTLTQLGRVDEAEPILVEVCADHPSYNMDLAWLYERKKDYDRALCVIEQHLETHPNNSYAQGHLLRLRARGLEAEELIDEVETLRDLGEEVPADLMPEYVETLLRTGQGSQARAVVREGIGGYDMRLAASLAWVCHKLQAYDLALDLFLKAYPVNRTNHKFQSALETAAQRCGRIGDVITLYEVHAPEDKRLFGRIKNLQRRLEAGEV